MTHWCDYLEFSKGCFSITHTICVCVSFHWMQVYIMYNARLITFMNRYRVACNVNTNLSNWFYGPVDTVKCNFLQTTDTSSQYVSKATYHIGICTKCFISHSWYMFITWYLCWEVVESQAPTKARYFDVRPSPVVLMATKKSYFLLENQVISILVKTNQVF